MTSDSYFPRLCQQRRSRVLKKLPQPFLVPLTSSPAGLVFSYQTIVAFVSSESLLQCVQRLFFIFKFSATRDEYFQFLNFNLNLLQREQNLVLPICAHVCYSCTRDICAMVQLMDGWHPEGNCFPFESSLYACCMWDLFRSLYTTLQACADAAGQHVCLNCR